jgi:hypothetical protein
MESPPDCNSHNGFSDAPDTATATGCLDRMADHEKRWSVPLSKVIEKTRTKMSVSHAD